MTNKMKQALIISIVLLGGTVFYMIHIHKLEIETETIDSTPGIKETNKVPVTIKPLVKDNDSPEIGNTDYTYLGNILDVCHPGMKDEIRRALSTNDMITEKEYQFIIHKCSVYIEKQQSRTKQELKEIVK